MQLTFYEVASVLKAKNDVHQFPNCTFRNVEFDSRLIEEGDLFLPLKGARDGHDFIATAFENGAVATSGISKKGQHIKSENKLEHIQVTVVGKYLSDVDVLATVGVATDENTWREIVEKNKLSGILLTKEGIKRVFEEGKIIDVERT